MAAQASDNLQKLKCKALVTLEYDNILIQRRLKWMIRVKSTRRPTEPQMECQMAT